MELPDEADDASVVTREAATLTREDTPGVHLLRSRYRSQDLGAAAPAQLVSTPGHLYLFRQSKDGTLLCDRFVLDGMTNKLGRKLEVRFKRSRKRHEPFDPGKRGALAADSLDFRDAAGKLFHEPTTELCLVSGVADGWFSVVRVGTAEHEQYRWHVFSYNGSTKKIDAVSIRMSEEGLFDPKDALVLDPASTAGGPPLPRSVCGILRRTISVLGAVVTGGPAATTYDIQQERLVGSGPEMQLVRTATRLMLVVPTDKGTAAWSFGLAADGTLSEAARVVSTSLVRSDERDLLLPLDTLDQIKLFGAAAQVPTGTISAMRLGDGMDAAGGKVVVESPQAAALASRGYRRGPRYQQLQWPLPRERRRRRFVRHRAAARRRRGGRVGEARDREGRPPLRRHGHRLREDARRQAPGVRAKPRPRGRRRRADRRDGELRRRLPGDPDRRRDVRHRAQVDGRRGGQHQARVAEAARPPARRAGRLRRSAARGAPPGRRDHDHLLGVRGELAAKGGDGPRGVRREQPPHRVHLRAFGDGVCLLRLGQRRPGVRSRGQEGAAHRIQRWMDALGVYKEHHHQEERCLLQWCPVGHGHRIQGDRQGSPATPRRAHPGGARGEPAALRGDDRGPRHLRQGARRGGDHEPNARPFDGPGARDRGLLAARRRRRGARRSRRTRGRRTGCPAGRMRRGFALPRQARTRPSRSSFRRCRS